MFFISMLQEEIVVILLSLFTGKDVLSILSCKKAVDQKMAAMGKMLKKKATTAH